MKIIFANSKSKHSKRSSKRRFENHRKRQFFQFVIAIRIISFECVTN